MNFKVYVKTTGDRTWSTNAVQHDSVDDAAKAAQDLFMRWFAVEKWAVVPTSASGYLTDADIDALAVKRSDK